MHIHTDVDQADRGRLARIADEVFGDAPLDLVVDDCSHLYEATRASFNELFPRLRVGGIYTIEDWNWTHEERVAEMFADQVPLTRFILELMLVVASGSGVISEIAVADGLVRVTRGDEEVEARDFDILDCLEEGGLDALAG